MVKNGPIYLDKLYFYWGIGSFEGTNNSEIATFLPFEIDYNSDLKLLIQKKKNIVLKSLDKAYKLGSDIGNLLDLNPWSNEYGKDFLDFLDFVILNHTGEIRKILEIGCGQQCALLGRLKDRGYQVLGIEPSPLSVKAGSKIGVKVINDFFPSVYLKGKLFDLIFHSGVLEHVEDPVSFLKHQHDQLDNNGILVISTPDYTDSIANGDISMILHEHLSYFDKESLKFCVAVAGFNNIYIQRAKFGGFLYCLAKKGKNKTKLNLVAPNQTKIKYQHFLKKHKQLILRIRKYVREVLSDKNRTLGFYAPVRSLPYLSVLNLYQGIRFFDDNPYWHFKKFKGINIPIEDFEDLKKKPVTDLIIMSPTFGLVIEQKVRKYFKNKITIRKLKDFFG